MGRLENYWNNSKPNTRHGFQGGNMTNAEREHLDRVASMGCCVCRREGHGYTPAAIHHLRRNPVTGFKLGMSQRSPHSHTIGLCPKHHQTGGFGVAFHAGEREFERNHGTETELWEYTAALMEVMDGR